MTAPSIFNPGRNCWRVEHADRVAFLIDGAAYFRQLRAALKRARRSIFIVGWDFDSQITLDPTGLDDGRPAALGALLTDLVETRSSLEIRILIWDLAALFGPNHDTPPLLGPAWHAHERIKLRFDPGYVVGSAHHQKIVTIDDSIAFIGGIDLTTDRWDTPLHPADHPLRRETNGKPFGPVHDLQQAVDGDAARAVADVARARWHTATGEDVFASHDQWDLWPTDLPIWLRDVPVSISRTEPARGDGAGVREIEALLRDCLLRARQWIYVEAQYLASQLVGDMLCARLAEADGPEIVILVRCAGVGWVEALVMNTNRDRMLRRLKKADQHGRLRVFCPIAFGPVETEVLLHSKLVIVDGELVKLGSANLNNRSMGLDTECDLAIEARSECHRADITRLRDVLLAEHLGTSPDEVADAVIRCGSLVAAIDALNGGLRHLRAFEIAPEDGSDEPMPGTVLLDPAEPISFGYLRDMLGLGASDEAAGLGSDAENTEEAHG